MMLQAYVLWQTKYCSCNLTVFGDHFQCLHLTVHRFCIERGNQPDAKEGCSCKGYCVQPVHLNAGSHWFLPTKGRKSLGLVSIVSSATCVAFLLYVHAAS
jgi:hypothetical protein